MDLRLLLGGGAATAEPPKIAVGPPGEHSKSQEGKEFAKLMEKQSHSGETNGEVVESEPNAPLQNLDSVNDTEAELLVQSQLSALIASKNGAVIAPSQEVSSAPNSKEALASSSITFSLSSAGVPGQEVLSQSSVGKTADLQTTGTVENFAHQLGLNPSQVSISFSPSATPESQLTLAEPSLNLSAELEGVSAAVSNAQLDTNAEQNVPGELLPTSGENLGIQPVKSNEQQVAGEVSTDSTIGIDLSLGSVGGNEGGETDLGADSQQQGNSSSQSGLGNGTAEQGNRVTNDGTTDSAVTALNNSRALTTRERTEAVQQVLKNIDRLNLMHSREAVNIRLEPEQLGTVVIEIQKSINGLSANLEASNQPLREALDHSRNELAARLQARGINQIQISVQETSDSSALNNSTYQQSHSGGHNRQDAKQQPFITYSLPQLNPSMPESTASAWNRFSSTQLDIAI
jgi:flagellar hook-length control protein FliK